MRVITRHLTSQIILSTSLVLMALIGLFLFFDLVNQVDKIGSSYGMLQALAITGFSIPSHLYEVMPIGVLLGAVYTMSRWAANSEFTILRVAGMSPLSLTRSLMVPGLILVGFTYLLGEFVAPESDALRQEVQLKIYSRPLTASGYDSGVWARDQVYDNSKKLVLSRYVNVQSLKSGAAQEANGWRVYEFTTGNELHRMIEAPSGSYQEGKGWVLKDAVVTDFPSLLGGDPKAIPKPVVRHTEPSMVLSTTLAPRILSVIVADPDHMPILDLGSYLHHLKQNHEDTSRYEVAFWKKVFYPLSILVMLALSMPFVYLSTRSGGVSLKIFVGVMIGIAFYALNNLFSYIGILSTFPPIMAAITPILVTLILAAVAIAKVERR